MEKKSVVSPRGRTYYWIQKNPAAPPIALVFLPGLTADHRLFDRQIPVFAPRYTVLTWDAPAHGESRPYTDFSYTHLAEELKTILDTEGIQQVILVGQSGGGFVSQSFIRAYPSMVTALLTVGTTPFGREYYSKSDFFWLRQIEWMARLYPDKTLRKSMSKMCARDERAYRNMLTMLEWYPKRELCHLMYLGFAGFIPETGELTIPCPVWLTVGEFDHTGKVMQYNRRWREKDGYPLHIIKNAAHNANDDQPEAFNALLEQFLETVL